MRSVKARFEAAMGLHAQHQEEESRMSDSSKLLDTFTFKCAQDMKREIAGVASSEGMESSEFVRLAITEAIEKRRAMYEALHTVFGGPK